MERASGILMHLSSLPSPYGIGTLGAEARQFVDFLALSGQRYWQMLPIGPTSYGDSPYQSFSTFAGNPYFIDLELLCEDGLLTRAECEAPFWGSDPLRVDYAALYHARFPLLKKAFERGWDRDAQDVAAFEARNGDWLPDYALYMAIKSHFDMVSWTQWPDEAIRLRRPEALEKYTQMLGRRIRFWIYIQYLFDKQWRALHSYASEKGVSLIGDLPIYVALDSADAWANPSLFWLDGDRNPVCVAGCPPDYFAEKGQLWGNPLYDWAAAEREGYAWWCRRVERILNRFDLIRIDHFRGFESFYAIPFGAEDAVVGEWKKGPGMALFTALRSKLGALPVIAEDLGFLTEEVHALLRESGFPGMKVLQFAFDSGPDNLYLPHNYPRSCVVYTGTHDNDTLLGWLYSAPGHTLRFALDYLGAPEESALPAALMRAGMGSVAGLCICQMQDYLELDARSRMNIPSTPSGNWQWRMGKDDADDELAGRIREFTQRYGRVR